MPDICYTDASRVDVGVLRGASLNAVWGDSGNDFELTVDIASPERVEDGALVYVEGTEWGGVVDEREASSSDGTIRYRGRSWHGMLRDRVLCPDAGADYLTVSGEANAVLLSLVSRMGLSDVMTVSSAASGIEVRHRFERFTDAYSGIRAMLSASGARLAVAYDSVASRAVLSAVPVADWSDGPTSDQAGVDVTRVSRPYNHLVCLGSGELRDRVVQHWYADEAGKVSGKQSLFGVDERATTYDYSNAGADELSVKGPRKLSEYQRADSMDATLDVDGAYAVGDVVPGTDVGTGTEVSVVVGTVDATVDELGVTVTYRAGGTAPSGASSGSSESSGSGSGGAAYAAGEGISIVGRTISADVTQDKLDAVSKAAAKASQDAQGVANDLAAETTRATAAEKKNADAIAKETNRRANADNGIYAMLYRRPRGSEITLEEGEKYLTIEGGDGDGTEANRARVKIGTNMTALTDADAALGSRVDAEAKARADADAALSATAKGLRTDVDAAAKALAGKPSKTDTSMTYLLACDHGADKYWYRLGTLVSSGDASVATIHVMTGNGYNGMPSQNSEFWVYVKDGNSGAETNYAGTTVDLGVNCGGIVEVRVFATNSTTFDIWVKLPWPYPRGCYTVQGTYKSWTPNTSHDSQADPPSPAGQTEQPVATRTIASTAYVDGEVGGCQPKGDYAAKSHQHAASDVTSGVLPVARGGTGNDSGNAPTASRLASARTITLKGAVTGSASFDGSADVTITCEGKGAAASFLAAHPVGSLYESTSAVSPAGAYGGTWERVPSLGAFKWERKA